MPGRTVVATVRNVPLEHIRSLVRGASGFEWVGADLSPLRLPAWTRVEHADRWIELWAAHTLGVRIVTRTAATRIEVVATITRMVPPDAVEPPFPASIVATIDGEIVASVQIEGGPVILARPDRGWQFIDGPASVLILDLPPAGREREVTIWLPHNGHALLRSMRADRPLNPGAPDSRSRWVHHGSSVSQGLEATSPLGPWPQLAARALGLDLTNLAIAGNAQLDPFVARTIAATPADIVTLKLGVNIVNVDSMRRRAFIPALHGFLDLVREGHPETPIVVITPIVCPAVEDIPGPTRKLGDGRYHGTPRETVAGDGTLTLGIVREIVRDVTDARSRTDELLWAGDGLTLLGDADRAHLWDGLHPDQTGYSIMAERFVAQARDPDTDIGRAFARVLTPPQID